MAKIKSHYVCQDCGFQAPRWEGQCRGCNAWNTLVEEKVVKASPDRRRGWSTSDGDGPKVKSVNSANKEKLNSAERYITKINELDRVLGGGLVPGSYILLGGDPGIGKSTILLQMAGELASNKKSVLYISGEESVEQTALRAKRLNISSDSLLVAAESQLETILNLARTKKPDVLIVDSIQTVFLQELQSAPGSVAQVRECASSLMGLAKTEGVVVFIIGHVTKDGQIAGPKVLEHMVDTVLSFEGDSNHQFRLLRALKNRFGPTNELGVFEMNSSGLIEVTNPSEIFIEERGDDLVGSSIFSAMEGTRPLLCEVQALSTDSPTHIPRRTTVGFDTNRVHLLVAVLSKHLDMDLSKEDVFVNVVGGLKLQEPAADLAVAAALISSHLQIEMHPKACFAGEIGLTGEVRGISLAEDRVKEATKLGFKYFILPAANKKHLQKTFKEQNLIFIKSVDDLKNVLRNLSGRSTGAAAQPTTSVEAELN